MNIINAIKWGITWISLTILKRTLQYKLKEDSGYWLQPIQSNQPKIFNRVDYILDYCRHKRVLHLGFTDYPYTLQKISNGSLLHLKLKASTKSLIGMDIEEESIIQYSSATNDSNVFKGDVMIGYPLTVIEFKPEIILMGEVLEHLKNPGKAIEVLYESFGEGTTVLITVPNYTSLDSISASINKTETIHPYHHWYFSPYTLRQLFDEKRFKLKELHFGMYYQPKTKINRVLQNFPFNGDCIIALFTITKTPFI